MHSSSTSGRSPLAISPPPPSSLPLFPSFPLHLLPLPSSLGISSLKGGRRVRTLRLTYASLPTRAHTSPSTFGFGRRNVPNGMTEMRVRGAKTATRYGVEMGVATTSSPFFSSPSPPPRFEEPHKFTLGATRYAHPHSVFLFHLSSFSCLVLPKRSSYSR